MINSAADITFHYPPELFNLMVDTIPLLNKSKNNVLIFFRDAGVADAMLSDLNPYDLKKREIVQIILKRLNKRGEASLKERRQVLQRVVEFANFDTCWPDDQMIAKELVASIREVVDQKYAGYLTDGSRLVDSHKEVPSNTGLVPRIEALKVRNFRALADVEISDVTPLTVLVGPNGSGKSTVFDVFAFLSECFRNGLRSAWDRRGKSRELKTRGRSGTVMIEIKYRERAIKPRSPLITYHLEIEEENGKPIVEREWLRWKRQSYGQPFLFMEYARGAGRVVSGEMPDKEDQRIEVPLSSPGTLAVNALGQLAENPRVVAFRNFVMSWHMSHLSAENSRGQPEAGPQERLNPAGDNLANVIQHLSERDSDLLDEIFARLRERVPRIEKVTASTMPDGRLLLQIKDAPFVDPIMARFASDGTLKMLTYLILLHDPAPAQFIGIEEPENFLHPRLLHGLAEECQYAAKKATQILVTTHSPFFLNALRSEEVRVLWRDENGHTQCHSVAKDERIRAFMNTGAHLGDLWMEGYFQAGDPLTREGAPPNRKRKRR